MGFEAIEQRSQLVKKMEADYPALESQGIKMVRPTAAFADKQKRFPSVEK